MNNDAHEKAFKEALNRWAATEGDDSGMARYFFFKGAEYGARIVKLTYEDAITEIETKFEEAR